MKEDNIENNKQDINEENVNNENNNNNKTSEIKDNSGSNNLNINNKKKLSKQVFGHDLKRLLKNFDRKTIIYQIPGTGELKKNYDKIAAEIKKVELNIKKENQLKLKKKLENNDFYYENIMGYNFLFELNEEKLKENLFDIESYNISEVISKFKIEPENRTIEDLYIIKNYLFQTKLTENFRFEFNDEKKVIENLITFCGIEFRYKKFFKNEIIFKIGDSSDNFYMILSGKIDLYKTLPKIKEMTGSEYFHYIMNLKKNNETYRYKLCIKKNVEEYPINPEDELILPYIYLSYVLEDINRGEEIENFKYYLDLVNLTTKDIGLREDEIDSIDHIVTKIKAIKKKFPYIPENKIRGYRFINNKIVKKSITIFEYDKFMYFKPLDYFGENSIENNAPRNGTTVCSEETEVIYISDKLYINNILIKKAIVLEKKTSFLCKNYLFRKITQKKFEKKYFSYFIFETYHKGDILFHENDKLKYVYFIKEGNVKLITSKSILELEILINEINKKISMVHNYFNNNEGDDNEIITYFYNNLRCDIPEIIGHINKKEEIKIFIVKEGDEIGIEPYFLGINNFNTCVVDSIIAKIYKIDVNYLTEIFSYEKPSFFDLVYLVEKKLKAFSKRLFEINNAKISLTDQKIIEEKKRNFQKEYKIFLNSSNFSSQNKLGVNYYKFKEIVDNFNTINNNHHPLKYKELTLPNLSKGLNNNISNSSSIAFDNFGNLSKIKIKDIKYKKTGNIKKTYTSNDIKEYYLQTISHKNTSCITKSSFDWNKKVNNRKKFYLTLENSFRKRRKRFPYEDEFMHHIKNDLNNMVKKKFIFTKSLRNDLTNKEIDDTKNLTQENIDSKENNDTIALNEDKKNIENSQNNNNTINIDDVSKIKDITEKNEDEALLNKKILRTQINNYNKNININNMLLKTENFNKKKNNNSVSRETLFNKSHLNKRNLINLRKKFSFNIFNKKSLTDKNIQKKYEKNEPNLNPLSINKSHNINKNFLYSHNNINRNINHPYISPLTLVKLEKYKIFVENNKFLEDKKRYELNLKQNYRNRGLNEFGFPISFNKIFIRRNNIIKNN